MQKKFDPKVFQLGYVALGTPDIERAKQHYLRNLGMTEVAKDGDGSASVARLQPPRCPPATRRSKGVP